MKNKSLMKVIAVFLALGMFISYMPVSVTAETVVPQQIVTVDAAVEEEIKLNGTATYWVEFDNTADLSQAYFMDWSQRGWFVYETLKAQADKTQAAAKAYLNSAGLEYQSFWIANRILVKNSTQMVLSNLQELPHVTSITAQKQYMLYEPEQVEFTEEAKAVEPNIAHVLAPEAWALGFDGSGMIVANNDTGVRYSHEALVDQYRGNLGGGSFDHNYNWYNPYNPLDAVPRDGNNHGTHTMGTMVGDDGGSNQIGIAPGAEWLACAGCPDGSCYDESLLGCGEFFAAPHDLTGANPNPDMRPHVVNNSWGDCGTVYDDWYADVIDVWHAAGVYPVFSNGNAGNCGYPAPPGLNTVGNPARAGNVTGVGSSTRDTGQYATHSNWGPTDDPDTINPVDGFAMLKPQVIAPGANIRSCTPGSDSTYQGGWSGTSMSAPHVSGLVALIMQAGPCLVGDYAMVENIIESTATHITYDDGSPLTPSNYPNFATGWGEINVLAAVQMAAGACGNSVLTGAVNSGSNTPISGAKVEITGSDPANNRTVYTNASGIYTASVNADTYDMVASAFGHENDTADDIVVTEGATVEQDFVLNALPSTVITGTVIDGGIEETSIGHGYPLYAKLTFTTGSNATTVFTDPFTGTFTASVLQETEYNVTVEGITAEYLPYTDTLTTSTPTLIYDVELLVAAEGCGTAGYAVSGVVEDFNSLALPAGWSTYDYIGSGQVWHFHDPRGRGNQTGGEGGFAMVDSDWYGYGNGQLTGLRTPVLDFTGVPTVTLEFESYVRRYSGQYQSVRVSTDAGATWTTALNLPDVTQAFSYSIDLSTNLANESQAMIEFLFEGDWGYYWQVDNVLVGDPNCEMIPGGAVAGYVFDDNAIDVKLIGATVATEANAVETMAFADEAGNGLYWMFEPTDIDPEDVEFTVSKNQYETATETRSIAQDAVNHYDFILGTGYLVPEPLALEMTMELGAPDETQTLTLLNSGTGAAEFIISEKNLGFNPLGIHIPAFTGEIEKSGIPSSMLRDPEAATNHSGIRLNGKAADYGITAAPPAYGIDLLNDSLYNWPDAAVPGTSNLVGTPSATSIFAGDFMGADFDTLYAISYDNNKLYAIDTATAVATEIGTTVPPTGTFAGLSGGPDVMYGITTDCNVASTLVEVDLDTAAVTTIGTLPNATCMIDIAYVPSEDAIYGVDLVTNSLHRIDPATGVDTIVGNLGVDANYAQGMDYDEENGILYWAAYTTLAELRIIDIYTGASVAVGAFTQGEVDAYAIAAGGGSMDRVPWLDEDPLEGTIAEDDSQDITLTYTVAGIGQPGDYLAELIVKSNTPYPNLAIPVTLHVARPADYGTIKGDVFVLEKCDINPTPAEDVFVKFYQNATLKYSTMTDENGHYSYAMPAGTYDVEFVLNGYVDQFIQGVVLDEDEDVILNDVTLRINEPCLVVDPEQLYQELYTGEIAIRELIFTNTGAKEAVFEISERPGAGPVPFARQTLAEQLILDPSFEIYTPNPYWDDYSRMYGSPLCTEDDCGLGTGSGPHSGLVWTWFGGSATGDDGYVSQDVEIMPGIATMTFWVEQVVCGDAGANNWMALKIDGEEVWRTDGLDSACGNYGYREVEVDVSDYADGDTHEIKFESSTAGSGNFFLDDVELNLDEGGTPGDIPWLTLDPMAGVVLPDGGTVKITVDFDATGLLWGDYFGTLRVQNTPDPTFNIPVQLRVKDWNMQYLPLINNRYPIPGK